MRRVLGTLAAVALLLSGCTGVPDSSTPQVVGTVGVGGDDQSNQPETPAPGVVPGILVQNFLAVSSNDTGRHASARSFLTAAARSSWTDNTVTVVASTPSVSGYVPGKPIVASAVQLGTVSPAGVYTPAQQAGRAAKVQFSFGIARVGGQYRINTLRNGLVLTEQQFLNSFVPRSLYFLDLAHRKLVPDLRWTTDDDPIQVSETLMNLLVAGPSSSLADAVNTDTLPAGANSRQVNVTGGDPVRIEIVGASQLPMASKDLLAAQIAATLGDIDRGRSLEITDGGRPITIPAVGGKDFASSDFADGAAGQPVSELYYVRGGQLVFYKNRQVVPGPLDDGRYPLISAAVSRSDPSGNLTVAGVTDVDGVPRLVMGSEDTGLHRTTVTGVTSRPAFAPGRVAGGVEAWIGAGTHLYRTVLSGTRTTTFPVPLPTAVAGQQVKALRLSPEGSRIAVVLRDNAGHQALYVGAVVRTSAAQVSLGTLDQISPLGVTVNDLAWIEGERLNAIGVNTETQEPHVYRTGADGSAWTEYGISGLPGPPVTLAGAPGAQAWAAANTNVYIQVAPTLWANPGGRSTAALGAAPTYVE